MNCNCRLPFDAGSFAVTGPVFNKDCPIHGVQEIKAGYSCGTPGCPGEHRSKWEVCSATE